MFLLEGAGECVRGYGLQPGEQGQVAVVEITGAQHVGEFYPRCHQVYK